jgi:hypothetical protein
VQARHARLATHALAAHGLAGHRLAGHVLLAAHGLARHRLARRGLLAAAVLVGRQAGDRHALGGQGRLPVGLRRNRLARHALLARPWHGLLARLRRPARLALAGIGASLRLGNARLRLQS